MEASQMVPAMPARSHLTTSLQSPVAVRRKNSSGGLPTQSSSTLSCSWISSWPLTLTAKITARTSPSTWPTDPITPGSSPAYHGKYKTVCRTVVKCGTQQLSTSLAERSHTLQLSYRQSCISRDKQERSQE